MRQQSQRSSPRHQLDEMPKQLVPEVHSLNLGVLRTPEKLRTIVNDSIVEVGLGALKISNCYGEEFQFRSWRSRGKIPGFDQSMPEVRFYLHHDFQRLASAAERSSHHSGLGLENGADSTLGWIDYEDKRKIIEIALPASIREIADDKVRMSDLELKLLLARVVHEATHAAHGDSEFSAFMSYHNFLHRVGLEERAPNPIDIMKSIYNQYPADEHVTALNDFEEQFPESAADYYAWLESVERS